MTTDQFDIIITELRAIREALSKPNASTIPLGSSDAAPASASGAAFAARPPIPQPTFVVDDPDSVVVHFGKNNGMPIGQLGERSIEWYASVKEPKLDRTGKPFAPRPDDVALENAARQIIHRRRNTLDASLKPGAPAVSIEDFDSGDSF